MYCGASMCGEDPFLLSEDGNRKTNFAGCVNEQFDTMNVTGTLHDPDSKSCSTTSSYLTLTTTGFEFTFHSPPLTAFMISIFSICVSAYMLLLTFALSAAARLQGGQGQMQSRGIMVTGQITSADSTRDAGLCLGAESNADGAAVVITLCGTIDPTFPNGNKTWLASIAPSTGTISTFSNKCLDVTNGNAVNGQTLQVWTCAKGNTNQMFLATDDSQIQWVGTNFCVDLTNGDTTPGTPIQIWDCAVPATSNNNQVWFL